MVSRLALIRISQPKLFDYYSIMSASRSQSKMDMSIWFEGSSFKAEPNVQKCILIQRRQAQYRSILHAEKRIADSTPKRDD